MRLKLFMGELERGGVVRLAKEIGVSKSYLSQMASGAAPISPARAVAIERATNGMVTRRDLRPHDWASIWPELMERDAA